MRILMLTEFYPPIIGGIEQHVRNLSAALVTLGHEVAVATVWQKGMAESENDRGVRVYRIHGTLQRAAWLFTEQARRHVPPLPDPELVAGLKNVITREHPDVVHAHNWLVHSFLPLKHWSRARLVVTLHDYGLVCANQRLWYHEAVCDGPGQQCFACAAARYGTPRGVATVLANWTMGMVEKRLVDMFLPVSQAVAAGTRLADRALPFQVIPNFIPDDLDAYAPADPPPGTQLPKEYLLFVGDISLDKGVGVLLRAYAGLQHPIPLVLIGRCKMELPDDLPNVTIVPGLPHDAVMRTWRSSILGLAPSIWSDPCPTVVMEAMATGRPVIASRIGGLSDLVSDEQTGLLVPAGDVVALRSAMERLIGDRDLRSRLGQAAKQRVVEFQAKSVVPRIERAYQRVVASPWR